MNNLTILCGEALEHLRALESESVHCCVTSPPYFGLRDYGVEGQIGLEKTPNEYVAKLIAVFEEVRRVLQKDGTLWLNLGDSYVSSGKSGKENGLNDFAREVRGQRDNGPKTSQRTHGRAPTPSGCKPKDLIGIPWMVAFALRSAGWWLRSDIIWAKPNCMPESVTDRPTRSHEYIFLLTKSARYHYDADAIKEISTTVEDRPFGVYRETLYDYDCKEKVLRPKKFTGGAYSPPGQKAHSNARIDKQQNGNRTYEGFNRRWDEKEANGDAPVMRNKRDVWLIPSGNFADAHFATFPPDLIKPCILAGCPAGGTVLDPFAGSGTTGQVALELGRKAVLIELNPDYIKLIEQRTFVTPGLLL